MRWRDPVLELELVTIAFDNRLVVDLQHGLLKVHVRDRYHWTVADNSSSTGRSATLRRFCAANHLVYLPLAAQPVHWPGPQQVSR